MKRDITGPIRSFSTHRHTHTQSGAEAALAGHEKCIRQPSRHFPIQVRTAGARHTALYPFSPLFLHLVLRHTAKLPALFRSKVTCSHNFPSPVHGNHPRPPTTAILLLLPSNLQTRANSLSPPPPSLSFARRPPTPLFFINNCAARIRLPAMRLGFSGFIK